MANNVSSYDWCKFSKNSTNKALEVKSSKINPAKEDKLKKAVLKSQTLLKRSDKPINKKSKNKEEVTPATYNSVLARDKGCRLKDKDCKGKLVLHHINGRGKGRTNNIDNCIMLCNHHHSEVVHKNNKKYRPILQEIVKNKCNE